MGALSWVRIVRRVAGLAPQPEYPNLEALLQAQVGQMHEDYRVLSYVMPIVFSSIGLGLFLPLSLAVSPFFAIGVAGFLIVAAGSWFACDRMDKTIPKARQRIGKLGEQIWGRYSGFANIVGVEPCLSPKVAEVLDEAARIYLKYKPDRKSPSRGVFDEAHERAVFALEEAMAKMLEMARPDTVAAQEAELEAGWAMPLLQEMREMDRALVGRSLLSRSTAGDPIAGLREARLELHRLDNAVEELEQRQR